MTKFQDKERILKAAREKQEVIYKGAPIRLAADFSMETLQARREWQKIFQAMLLIFILIVQLKIIGPSMLLETV